LGTNAKPFNFTVFTRRPTDKIAMFLRSIRSGFLINFVFKKSYSFVYIFEGRSQMTDHGVLLRHSTRISKRNCLLYPTYIKIQCEADGKVILEDVKLNPGSSTRCLVTNGLRTSAENSSITSVSRFTRTNKTSQNIVTSGFCMTWARVSKTWPFSHRSC
jgi:hypothetical protein